MKKWILTAAAVVVAVPTFAMEINEGTQEILFSGSIDGDTPNGTQTEFEIGYGYFVMDQVVVGGLFNIDNNDFNSTYVFGGFTEYNWNVDTPWTPYLGASLQWGTNDPDEGSSNDAFVLTPYAGLKYFFSDWVAIYGEFDYNFASDDIFFDENLQLDDTNYKLSFGLRVYLGH